MSNKENSLQPFNKSNVEIYMRRRFRILHLCVCTFVESWERKYRNPSVHYVCVCVCDRAIDRERE